MTVTTNTGQVIPTICGANNGEHIYIDIGAANSDTATVAFTIGTTSSTSRKWDIKVAQIPCGANYAPPDGCLQYQTGLTGRFSSFNWADSTTAVHLASQTQNLCIRQEAGYCCVQYQVLDIPCQLLNLSISCTSRTFRRIAVSSVALKDLGWSW